MRNKYFCVRSIILIASFCLSDQAASTHPTRPGKIILSDKEWKKRLADEEYNVCRKSGTEKAGSGKWLTNKEKGVYTCACCGTELFHSSTKFHSGTGWPSFFDVLKDKDVPNLLAIDTHTDTSHGMTRTEVRCGKCEAHLGHVFDDGPPPTGLRYCINSVCLHFKPDVLDKKETTNEL
ncbi:unnamed protein product [Candidula unifasciata]|uniref:Peptide-methionine (R)-S-oxide reductase n=1 Tax=Candidula unifasciata TaxID=100452 RepID=A0A8S3ZII4_9EUPU|nr:unnamed protein product [Candidula unifasciata]